MWFKSLHRLLWGLVQGTRHGGCWGRGIIAPWAGVWVRRDWCKGPKAGSHSKLSSAFVSGGGWKAVLVWLAWLDRQQDWCLKCQKSLGWAQGPGHLSGMGSAQLCVTLGWGRGWGLSLSYLCPSAAVPQVPTLLNFGFPALLPSPEASHVLGTRGSPGSAQLCLTCQGSSRQQGVGGELEQCLTWNKEFVRKNCLTKLCYLGMTLGAWLWQQEGRRGSSAGKWRPREVVGAGVRWNPSRCCWEHWTRASGSWQGHSRALCLRIGGILSGFGRLWGLLEKGADFKQSVPYLWQLPASCWPRLVQGNHRDTGTSGTMWKKNRREKRNVARRGRGFSFCWGEAASTAANAGNGCTSVVLWDCQAQETFFLSFFPLPVNFPQKVMAWHGHGWFAIPAQPFCAQGSLGIQDCLLRAMISLQSTCCYSDC